MWNPAFVELLVVLWFCQFCNNNLLYQTTVYNNSALPHYLPGAWWGPNICESQFKSYFYQYESLQTLLLFLQQIFKQKGGESQIGIMSFFLIYVMCKDSCHVQLTQHMMCLLWWMKTLIYIIRTIYFIQTCKILQAAQEVTPALSLSVGKTFLSVGNTSLLVDF